MSFEKRDFRHGGPNLYATCEDWNNVQYTPLGVTSEDSCFEAIFYMSPNQDKINNLFQHLYFKYTALNSSGEKVETVGDCGLSIAQILADFLAIYGERPMVKKFYPCDLERATPKSVKEMAAKVKAVLDLNEFKYRKLIQTLGLSYDPIENYSMVENEATGAIEEGKEKNTHLVNASAIGGIEVEGPVSSVTMSEPDPVTGLKSIDVTLDNNRKLSTTTDSVSDSEAGQKVGGTAAAPSVAAGTTPTVKNYTTTMDDASTGRLHNYSETTGTTAQALKSNVETDYPIRAKVYSGAPNHPSYTDTKEYLDKTKEEARELSRRGNIGVTTSQQMLEQERQVVRFSVIEEFFKDLENQLLLSCY